MNYSIIDIRNTPAITVSLMEKEDIEDIKISSRLPKSGEIAWGFLAKTLLVPTVIHAVTCNSSYVENSIRFKPLVCRMAPFQSCVSTVVVPFIVRCGCLRARQSLNYDGTLALH